MKFTIDEIKEIIKNKHAKETIITIDNSIKHLRIMEKEYQIGKREMGGVQILNTWVQDGTIKPELYFKMREAIENPETPYIITEK